MAKTSINITIDTDVLDKVEELRKKPIENRNLSNMVETLVREALIARNILKQGVSHTKTKKN